MEQSVGFQAKHLEENAGNLVSPFVGELSQTPDWIGGKARGKDLKLIETGLNPDEMGLALGIGDAQERGETGILAGTGQDHGTHQGEILAIAKLKVAVGFPQGLEAALNQGFSRVQPKWPALGRIKSGRQSRMGIRGRSMDAIGRRTAYLESRHAVLVRERNLQFGLQEHHLAVGKGGSIWVGQEDLNFVAVASGLGCREGSVGLLPVQGGGLLEALADDQCEKHDQEGRAEEEEPTDHLV